MTEIISYLITAAAIVAVYSLLRFTVKRLGLLFKLVGLKRATGAEIKLHSFPLRPMWAVGQNPDITVKILDTVYRIRLYSGGGAAKSVHFSDRCWSVIYSKIKAGTVSPRRKNARLVNISNLTVGARVVHIPDIARADDPRVVDVLLFNPAPAEVSFVTDEGNSIRLAFTGDEMQGYTVFTASTFVRYAERRYREEKEKISAVKYY